MCARRRARVGAGVTWGEVQKAAAAHGLAGLAEPGALGVRDALGLGDRLFRWHTGVLGRGSVGAPGGGVVDPPALAEAHRVDVCPHRVDLTGTVLVGDLPEGRQRSPGRAHFPVGRVHSRPAHSDTHLSGARHRVREFGDAQHGSGRTTLMVDGNLHRMASQIRRGRWPLRALVGVNADASERRARTPAPPAVMGGTLVPVPAAACPPRQAGGLAADSSGSAGPTSEPSSSDEAKPPRSSR